MARPSLPAVDDITVAVALDIVACGKMCDSKLSYGAYTVLSCSVGGATGAVADVVVVKTLVTMAVSCVTVVCWEILVVPPTGCG